jgi:hypothetical protein
MVEGVVDEAEALAEIEVLDRLDGVRLEAERALLEAERLDQAADAGSARIGANPRSA